ncbi:MAG: ABC transporter permease [Rhodothermales bacterium]
MPARWPRPLTPHRRRALACEIEEELRTHLALRADDNRRAGMAPAEAEADALDRFGDVEHIAAACLWAEQTHPLREVQRLVVTGLVFAVGFGAFAAAFSLAVAVFVRPLRFDDADRLVRSGAGWEDALVPPDVVARWQAEGTSFERLTAFNALDLALGGDAPDERVEVMLISDDYFRVFRVAPIVGRTLSHGEREEILISDGLWERRFQRSRSALGATLDLDGQPHTVVGVMPEAAQLSHRVDLWHRLPASWPADRGLYVVGRLREGVTLAEVRAEVAPLTIAQAPTLHPLKQLYADPVRPMAWRAFGLSALVLLALAFAALRHAHGRARRAALYGGDDADPAVQIGMAVGAALAGLVLAHATQALVYDDLLGRWGPMFDRGLDGPVVLGVLGVGLAVGVLLVAGSQQRGGVRHRA